MHAHADADAQHARTHTHTQTHTALAHTHVTCLCYAPLPGPLHLPYQAASQGAAGQGEASIELLVTGHSLGGGLATLCALRPTFLLPTLPRIAYFVLPTAYCPLTTAYFNC